MKLVIAHQIYLILGQAELKGLTSDEKYKVITLAREFKKVSQEFEDFIKDTQESVKDRVELNSIIEKEADKNITISSDKLGNIFDKLMDSNNWNVAQILMLEDNIK